MTLKLQTMLHAAVWLQAKVRECGIERCPRLYAGPVSCGAI